ncbi:hypothetical protein IFVP182_C260017 [Vibrio parahaemolyticus]
MTKLGASLECFYTKNNPLNANLANAHNTLMLRDVLGRLALTCL